MWACDWRGVFVIDDSWLMRLIMQKEKWFAVEKWNISWDLSQHCIQCAIEGFVYHTINYDNAKKNIERVCNKCAI